MTYRCDNGEFRVTVYLEDGCEGPRDRVILAKTMKGHPLGEGQPVQLAFTASGRDVLPVPFVAGRCPAGHAMIHVDWKADQTFDPMVAGDVLPDDAGVFLYPSRRDRRRLGDHACGMFAWVRELRP